MSPQEVALLKRLYETFHNVPKPEPLSSLEGSYSHQGVVLFNSIDWEAVSFSNYTKGGEGWIACHPNTVVYLIPRIIRMIVTQRSKNDAADNATHDLECRLLDGYQSAEISQLLNFEQKRAVIEAFAFMDSVYYGDPYCKPAIKIASVFNVS